MKRWNPDQPREPDQGSGLPLPTRVARSAVRRRAVLRGGSRIGFQASRLGALLRAVDLPATAAAAGDRLPSATATGEEARRLLRRRRHRVAQVWKRTATRGISRASRTDSGAPLRHSYLGEFRFFDDDRILLQRAGRDASRGDRWSPRRTTEKAQDSDSCSLSAWPSRNQQEGAV
jgi:hypothetical protein